MVFGFVVPSGEEAPRRVRQAIRERLRGALEVKLAADLELLVSEVVTNAVRHGGSARGDEIDIRVELAGDTVSVCITDTGTGFRPDGRAQPRFGKDPGGFGLLLLDRLSTRWGIERDERGFRVWFRLNGRSAPE
ncbi:MAG TPA: ATP-binding protein [Solirubrobacteraceae bacterium]|jgi:anti-sigma regulatory factor (Ser/Thr protein kinase)|nr:ATP-binding protein [Solirubrobacteraceae bacterium]